MCVMFALMAVLWVVLALPTIDQQLCALFCFLCQHCPLSAHKEALSRRRAATHHRRQASVLQIREDDDTSDGEGEGETATKPRLSGSQELKKSEEGESIKEEAVDQQPEDEGAASSVETAKPKTKPKRRVRFSD